MREIKVHYFVKFRLKETEERLLPQKFSDYPEYVVHTRRFLPSPTRSR